MDWSNERYVKLYVRDTADWLALCWQAKALLPLLMRKCDRSGVAQVRNDARRLQRLSGLVGLPVEVVEAGIADLISDGCVIESDLGFTVRNFLPAQEATQSDRMRQEESRARRRELGVFDSERSVTKRDNPSRDVTNRDGKSQNVTESHELSQPVTPSLAEPSLAARETAPPEHGTVRKTRRSKQEAECHAPDPRHTPTRKRCEAAFKEIRGVDYRWGGGDASALSELLQFSQPDEIVDRFRRGLAASYKAISTLMGLRSHWNDHAPPAQRPLPLARQKRVAAEDNDHSRHAVGENLVGNGF